ncbi:MAG: arylsulfatase A-like enzyme [Mariniblastus sp.]|jgi:arylsulfatase A-like enzyme
MAATATAADLPKNIVLILADDLGWADTTLYGKTSLYETPNIQRLAARGMTFTDAYASPICSPTRASIMTGQNPARHGMTAPAAHLEVERYEAVASETGPPHQKCTNVKSATRLDPELPTLGKVLKDAGYATAHFGKWHLGREPHSPLEHSISISHTGTALDPRPVTLLRGAMRIRTSQSESPASILKIAWRKRPSSG